MRSLGSLKPDRSNREPPHPPFLDLVTSKSLAARIKTYWIHSATPELL
jgi:hypothetical protein